MADPTISSGYPRAISNPYATGTPRAATSGPAVDPYGQQRFAEGMQAATSYASVPAAPSYMGAMPPQAQYAYGMDPEDPRLQQAELLALRQQQDAMTQQGASMTPENALAMQKLASLGLNEAAAAQFIAENQDPQVSQAMVQAGQEVAQVTDKAAEEAKPKQRNGWLQAAGVAIPTALSFIPGVGTALAGATGAGINVLEQMSEGKSLDKVNYLEAGAVGAVSMIPGGAFGKVGLKVAGKLAGKEAAEAVIKGTATSALNKFAFRAVEKGVAGAGTGAIAGGGIEMARQFGSNESPDAGKILAAAGTGAVVGFVTGGTVGGVMGARSAAGTTPRHLNKWGRPEYIEAQAGGKFLSLPAKGVDAAGTQIARAGKAIGNKANQAKQAVSSKVDNFVQSKMGGADQIHSAGIQPNQARIVDANGVHINGNGRITPDGTHYNAQGQTVAVPINRPAGTDPILSAGPQPGQNFRVQPDGTAYNANGVITPKGKTYNAQGQLVAEPLPGTVGSNQYSKPIGPKPAIGHVPNPGQKVLPSAEMRSGPVDPSTGLPKPNLDAEGNILDPWAQPQPQAQPQTQAKAKTQSAQPEAQAETGAKPAQPEAQPVQSEPQAPKPESTAGDLIFFKGDKKGGVIEQPVRSREEIAQELFPTHGGWSKGVKGSGNIGVKGVPQGSAKSMSDFEPHSYQARLVDDLQNHYSNVTLDPKLGKPVALKDFDNAQQGADALGYIKDFYSQHLSSNGAGLVDGIGTSGHHINLASVIDDFVKARASKFSGQTFSPQHEANLHNAFETLQRLKPEQLEKLGLRLQ